MMMNQTKTPRPRKKMTSLKTSLMTSPNRLKISLPFQEDSGLGGSSASQGVGAGASVSSLVIHPHIKHDTTLPLPTRLPSVETLEELANDLYAYSGELFHGLEDTSMAMLDRILSGFKKSGGRARDYIHETAAIALNFFDRVSEMEAELESSEVLRFLECGK